MQTTRGPIKQKNKAANTLIICWMMTPMSDDIAVSIRIDRAFVRGLGGKTAMQFVMQDPADLFRLQMHYSINLTIEKPIRADILFDSLQSFVSLCDIIADQQLI